jgi:hypothetical protein
MTEKELNLLQLPAIRMAEFCASSPEVVWSEEFQLHPFSTPSDNVPNDILGDTITSRRPMTAYGSEDSAGDHLRRFSPPIDCVFDPDRHRNGPDMTTLANQIHDCPMTLSDLQILDRKGRKLGPA